MAKWRHGVDRKTHAPAVGPERHPCVPACLKAFRDNERVADAGVVRAVTPGEPNGQIIDGQQNRLWTNDSL